MKNHTLFDLNKVPALTTTRLILDGLQPQDLDAFAAMLADPKVGSGKGFPKGATRGEAWAGLANVYGHWVLRGFGLFAVRLRDTGGFVGTVGLVAPEGWPSPEATWTIAFEHQNKGYATEAAIAIRNYAFATMGLEKIVSYIPPNNAPSLRVAAALGMAKEGRARLFGEPVEVWCCSKN